MRTSLSLSNYQSFAYETSNLTLGPSVLLIRVSLIASVSGTPGTIKRYVRVGWLSGVSYHPASHVPGIQQQYRHTRYHGMEG